MKEMLGVLIVDDDANLRMSLCDILQANGYGSVAVAKGRTALERVKEEKPAVALIDLKLEDMSGLEVIKGIKKRSPDTECILLTAHASQESAIEAVNLGAYSYIQKPHDVDQLLVTIHRAIEKRNTEKDLRASQQFARGLISGSWDMIIAVDTDRRITEFNRAAEEAFGYRSEEVLGRHVDILYADPQEGRRVHQAAVEHGQCVQEVLNRRKDGEVFPSSLAVSVLRDPRGQVAGVMGISRDITDRKRAEEDLRETNRRLAEAISQLGEAHQQVVVQERLRALGQMASGIAHDFNNALSQILGYSELLLDRPEDLDDKEKVTRYLKLMRIAASDAAEIVRRMREFYRPREEGESFSPLAINELVEASVLLTQPRWKDQAQAQGVRITMQTDLQDVPRVAGNEVELREMLTNLIFNAVEAMPMGGRIAIRTRCDDHQVVLEVSDTGTGMTEEVRRRCWEPFFSTKGAGGSGLGLAAVHGIVERHQGSTEVQSEPGKGTTFRILLPVGKDAKEAAAGGDVESSSRGLHVLLVDDEREVCKLLAEYLTADGHSVETAADGCEGLQKFRAGWFDLIVTDRAMPDMSGDQLAAAIKKIAPNKPLIMLTGFGDMMAASGEHPVGVDLVVPKPSTLAAFREAISEVMASKAGWSVPREPAAQWSDA